MSSTTETQIIAMIATCYMMVLGFLKFIGTCTIYLRENRKLSIDRQNLLQPGKLAIGKGYKTQKGRSH